MFFHPVFHHLFHPPKSAFRPMSTRGSCASRRARRQTFRFSRKNRPRDATLLTLCVCVYTHSPLVCMCMCIHTFRAVRAVRPARRSPRPISLKGREPISRPSRRRVLSTPENITPERILCIFRDGLRAEGVGVMAKFFQGVPFLPADAPQALKPEG